MKSIRDSAFIDPLTSRRLLSSPAMCTEYARAFEHTVCYMLDSNEATLDVSTSPARGRAGRARRRLGSTSRDLLPLLVVLALLALWEVAVRGLNVAEYVLPTPSRVASEMYAERSLLLEHTWITFYESVLGLLLSVLVGLPLAILIVYSRTFERTVYPLIVSSQTIPKVAIAPLLVFWFGLGVTPKVLVAFSIAFFPLVVSSVVGLASAPREMIYLARSMGASTIQTFAKIRFPHALPSIFAGLKVAATLCVVGAIVGEFVGSSGGLGYVVLVAQGVLDARLIFAAIVMMSLIGLVLFYAVVLLERLVVRWHVPEDDAARTAAVQSA